MSKVDVLLGLQWGDEGKGKVVDALTPHYDVIARFQGGANAGHTITFGNMTHVLHIIPSGIFHYNVINYIGNGVVIDPVILRQEIDDLIEMGIDPCRNLFISHRAQLILPTHRVLDAAYECAKGKSKIGSTLKGIGPTYTDKIARNGLRICDIATLDFMSKYKLLKEQHMDIIERIASFHNVDLDSLLKIGDYDFDSYEKTWFDAINFIKEHVGIVNGEYWLNGLINNGKKVLAEGAQGSMLDIDFGTYPFVTSSSTCIGGVCTGLGIPPSAIGKVFGITKAYCTRVGAGPFPTVQNNNIGELLRKRGKEFGATTGRPRDCGWLDLVALRYACMINGVTDLIITKGDVLDEFNEIQVCTQYIFNSRKIEEVPPYMEHIHPIYTSIPWSPIKGEDDTNLKEFLQLIGQFVAPASIYGISTGPDRDEMITF